MRVTSRSVSSPMEDDLLVCVEIKSLDKAKLDG